MKTSFKAKAALVGILALVGLLFLATSCEQPTDTSQTRRDTLEKLDSPKNLRVAAVTGAFIITWDPVLNADEYEVLRRNPSNNAWVSLGTVVSATGNIGTAQSGASTYSGPGNRDLSYYNTVFIDRVSYNNVLEERATYRYMVVAKKNNYGVTQQQYAMRESKAEAGSKRATIPAQGTYELPLPAAADVKFNSFVYGTYTSSSSTLSSYQDSLEVWWESKWEDSPVQYRVEYGYTFENIGFSYVIDPSTLVTGEYTYYKRALFPMLGGDAKVRITAYWEDGVNYYPIRQQEYDYTGSAKVLAVPTVTAAPAYNSTTPSYDSQTIQVSWNAVPGATGYEVYREEQPASSYYNTTQSGYDYKNGVIFTQVGATQMQDSSGWYLYDTPSQTVTEGITYYVIATNTDARSSTPGSSAVINLAPTTSVTLQNIIGPYRYDGNGSNAISVTLHWETEEGVTYRLLRAPITTTASSTTADTIGPYVELAATNGTTRTNGEAEYVDSVANDTNPLALYQSYMYMVQATKGDYTAVSSNTQFLTAAPFRSYINGLTVSTATGALYTITVTAPSIGTLNGTAYNPNGEIVMDIKYALVDTNNPIGAWTVLPGGTNVTAGQSVTFTPQIEYSTAVNAEDIFRRYIFAVDNIRYTPAGGTTTNLKVLSNAATTSYTFVRMPSFGSIWGVQDVTGYVVFTYTAAANAGIDTAKIYKSATYTTNTIGTGPTSMDRASSGAPIATVAYNSGAATTVNGATVPAGSFYFSVPKSSFTATPGTAGDTYTYMLGIQNDLGNKYADLTGFQKLDITNTAGTLSWY